MRRLLILSFLCCLSLFCFCQNDTLPVKKDRLLSQFNDLKKKSFYTNYSNHVNSKPVKSVLKEDDENTCTTTTFYMRMPAAAGEKIEIQNVQTLPDGDFISVGNSIKAGVTNGFIFRMKTDGAITIQQQILIDNNTVNIAKAKVLLNGDIIIAGIINNSGKTFVAKLTENFTAVWVQEISIQGKPLNVSLDIYSDNNTEAIALALQLNNTIVYCSVSIDGVFNWQNQVTINNLTHLTGFTYMIFGVLGLAVQCNNNGLEQTELEEINIATGVITKSSIIDNGAAENNFKAVTTFNDRLIMLGAANINGSFKLQRNILNTAAGIEIQHNFDLPEDVNLQSSFALDNSGDAMGVCIPDKGQLVFLKQYIDGLSVLEFTNEYNVPVGSTVTSIARSFDGGFIFILNNIDSTESVFIKTDSIGVLADCGYKTIKGKSSTLYSVQNTALNLSSSGAGLSTEKGSLKSVTANLSAAFNCRKNYCPALPPQDTCLSTYFKILRSGGYVDYIGNMGLMRNNNILINTRRYDRILGEINQITYTLKLFNEKAECIKSKEIAIDSDAIVYMMKKISDSTVIVISYRSRFNGDEEYTFTLISDALEIKWSKSYQIHVNSDLFGDIMSDGKDIYYYDAGPGYLGYQSRLTLFKMDEFGNAVWLKRYYLPTSLTSYIIGCITPTSLVFVQDGDGSYGNDASYSIDKNTGKLLNAYKFNMSWDGSGLLRLLQYDNNKLYYIGSDQDEKLAVGLFNSTGKPLSLKVFKDFHGARAGVESNSKLYISLDQYEQGHYSDVLTCLDSNLKLIFMNSYNMKDYYRLAHSVELSKEGNIYVGGNFSENYWYDYPFIIKYDAEGKSGTCSFQTENPSIDNIDPKPVSINVTVVDSPIVKVNAPISLVPDSRPLNISAVLCTSSPLCNTIKLSGPTKLCSINTDYIYHIQKNIGCNLQPVFFFDTAFVLLKKSTDSTVVVSFKKTGTIQLKVDINAGCKLIGDSLTIQVQKSPANFSLGNDTVLCPGTFLYLNAGTGFNTYTWQDGTADSVFKVEIPGEYYVQTTNVCNNVFSDTINIIASVVPTFTIGNDTSICVGDTIKLNASAGFKNYTWFPSTINAIGKDAFGVINTNELIHANAITNDGCTTSDSINITAKYARPVNLGNDTSFCEYDSVILNAGDGYKSYKWSNGNITQNIVINKAGNYFVVAKDVNDCFASDSLQILNVYAYPVPDLGNDKNICDGSSLTLNAGNYFTYNWNDGSSSQYLKITQPGTYWVKVTDNNHCIGSDTFNVSQLLQAPFGFLPTVDSLCFYDKLILTPSGSFVTYSWSTGEKQPTITVSKPGSYTLNVTDYNGCNGTSTTNVVEKDCMHGVYIPTAFTPNSDGKNDVFKALVFGKAVYFSFNIYDRFGELIFSTHDPSKGWNGLINGQPQNPGTYVWQCTYQLEGNDAKFEKGTVVLMH